MRNLIVGCLGLLVGLVLALAVVFFGLSFLNVQGLSQTPRELVRTTGKADVSITASSAFVSSQMQQALKQGGLVTRATVKLSAPNMMQVTAPVRVNVLGQVTTVNTTAAMAVRVQNGRALLSIEKIEAGGINVPRELLAPVMEEMRAEGEDQLNRLIQRNLQNTGLRLLDIRVTQDGMTIDLGNI